MSLFMVFHIITVNAAPKGIIGIHVIFSSKAYWDGVTKSCLPRDKGGCCHVWVDHAVGPGQIIGTLENAGNGKLIFTTSKAAGMQPETFTQLFIGDKFVLEGTLTFSSEVLSKLGLKSDFTIPGGTYPFTTNGDSITIPIK